MKISKYMTQKLITGIPEKTKDRPGEDIPRRGSFCFVPLGHWGPEGIRANPTSLRSPCTSRSYGTSAA